METQATFDAPERFCTQTCKLRLSMAGLLKLGRVQEVLHQVCWDCLRQRLAHRKLHPLQGSTFSGKGSA